MEIEYKPTIAVLSGKGGTGKTFVSVNLARVADQAYYLDCDVEEPNGHFFLEREDIKVEDVSVLIPKVNSQLCTACGRCVEFCNFNALALIADHLLVFEEICHSCGGCMLVCPEDALVEENKIIGKIEKGQSKDITLYTGILNIGEVSGVPIIEKMLDIEKESSKLIVIDCPPGTACSVMESIMYADYCLIVTEPTLFGLHNFKMVLELVDLFEKPYGVVINKSTSESNPLDEYCFQQQISIMARIPHDRKLATLISSGELVSEVEQEYNELFKKLLADILEDLS